jgi:mono/diheme cytochrome c family protein
MRLLFFSLVILIAAPLFGQSKGNSKKGADLYLEKCVLCHGSRGQGWDWSKKAEPPIPVPDLAKTTTTHSDQYLFDVVKGGGEAVGRTRFMPPFGFELNDPEVWDLVAYLRTLGRSAK